MLKHSKAIKLRKQFTYLLACSLALTVFFSIPTAAEETGGQVRSYLTGKMLDAGIARRRPIAVMIPTNKRALPQYGLSKAAIIFEAPVEGRTSRLMGVFEEFDGLDHIGPVRSARDYYVTQAMGYDAIYCNWGLAVPYVADLINSTQVDNISAKVSGIEVGADKAFGRIKRGGYALEYTGYLFVNGLIEEVGRLGYRWNYAASYQPQFTFAADGGRAEYADMPAANVIRPGGTGNNRSGYGVENPYFSYNPEDRLYYRSQNGKAQIDEATGAQLSVSNVVFQYCHGEVRDANDYLAFGVTGTDKAIVFTNGKVIEGTWSRAAANVPAKFYDKNGKEIIVNQGSTWICTIWKEYAEFVQYE